MRSNSRAKESESDGMGDRQTEQEEEERSERRGVRKVLYMEGGSKSSTGVTVRREGGVVRRVQRTEEEEVSTTVTVRQRRQISGLARTSDYSSQSDTERETAVLSTQPKNSRVATPPRNYRVATPPRNPRAGTPPRNPRVGSKQDSPRLRAFEGDAWIYSPRTGYTYSKSLTYRDTVTPGREVPMPHMTRLPLHGDPGHDFSQDLSMENTEMWERSVLESRTLGELSEDEFSPSPGHRIYRQGAWTTSEAQPRTHFSTSSYLVHILYLILMPLSTLLTWSKLVFRVLVYDIPAFTHRVDIGLLLKSEELRKLVSTCQTWVIEQWLHVATSLWSLLAHSTKLVLQMPAALASTFVAVVSSVMAWMKPTVSPAVMDGSGLISEDEEESGLDNFLTSQKEREVRGAEATEQFSLLGWFSSRWLLVSSFFISFLEPIKHAETAVTEDEEEHNDQITRTDTKILPVVLPTSIKKVMFKDLPEEPETGGVNPYETVKDPVLEISHINEELVNEVQQTHQVPKMVQNSLQIGNSNVGSHLGFLSDVVCLPFSMTKAAIYDVWRSVTKQPEPKLRRSRRLRGLNPEQKALERERRRRERRRNVENGGVATSESLLSDKEFDSESDDDKSFSDLNIKPKLGAKKPKNVRRENVSIWKWVVSLFYRQKPKRRSRRLKKLDPEMEALSEKKRSRAGQRKTDQLAQSDSKYLQNNDLLLEGLSVENGDEDETEFIPMAYLKSNLETLKKFIWEAVKSGPAEKTNLFYSEDTNNSEFHSSEVLTDTEVVKGNGAVKSGICKRALNTKSSFWAWGVSFFFRQKLRRRSRRLRGLGPEVEALEASKKKRTSKRNQLSAGPFLTPDAEYSEIDEHNISEYDPDQDEIEFIPFAFFGSIWQQLCSPFSKTIIEQVEELPVNGNPKKTVLPPDIEGSGLISEDEDQSGLESFLISEKNKRESMSLNRDQLVKTSIFSKTVNFTSVVHLTYLTYLSWLVSFFYRQRPRRRSRRLKGLCPEMETGTEMRKKRASKRNKLCVQENLEMPEDRDLSVAEDISEMSTEEGFETEFIPVAFVTSVWEGIKSRLTMKTNKSSEREMAIHGVIAEDDSTQDNVKVKDAIFTRILNYICSLYSCHWLVSFFYRQKPRRSSRRMRGLGPEMEVGIKREKTLASRRSNFGLKETSEVPKEADITIADAISEMDSIEEFETEFIPLALVTSVLKRIKSWFTRNGNETYVKETTMSGLTAKDDSTKGAVRVNEAMNIQILTYTGSLCSWLVSLCYRQKARRQSRRLRGLGPEVSGNTEDRRTRTSQKRQHGNISNADVDADAESSANESESEIQEDESEFIPFAVLVSCWLFMTSLLRKGAVAQAEATSNGVQFAASVAPKVEGSDKGSHWYLGWVDWDYVRQMFSNKKHNQESGAQDQQDNSALMNSEDEDTSGLESFLLSQKNGNGNIETSYNTRNKPWKTGSVWVWLASLFYREKVVRRSRRLAGMNPEMEAESRVNRLTRRNLVSSREVTSDNISMDGDGSEVDIEFIPLALAASVYQILSSTVRSVIYKKTETGQDYELRFVWWLRSLFSAPGLLLSRANVQRHNSSISAGGAGHSVGTWLANSPQGDATTNDNLKEAFSEEKGTKDLLEGPVQEQSEMAEQKKGMFSFLFLGSLPFWSSWFGTKKQRRSRRLEGLEPIEVEDLKRLKSKTRSGKVIGFDINDDTDSESSEGDDNTDKYLLLMLLFLLAVSALYYLAIFPLCSAYPDSCSTPYRTTRKFLANAGNTTSALFQTTGEELVKGATSLQNTIFWGFHILESSLRSSLHSLLFSPYHYFSSIPSSLVSLGSSVVAFTSSLGSSAVRSAAAAVSAVPGFLLSTWSLLTELPASFCLSGWERLSSFISLGLQGCVSLGSAVGGSVSSVFYLGWDWLTSIPSIAWGGLSPIDLTGWAGFSPISFASNLPSSLWSGLTNIVFLISEAGSSGLTAITNGASYGLNKLTVTCSGLFSLICGGLGEGINYVFTSLLQTITSINYLYPVTLAGELLGSGAQTVASGLGWLLSIDLTSPISWLWTPFASSWEAGTTWVIGLNPLAPFSWLWTSLSHTWEAVIVWSSAPFYHLWSLLSASCDAVTSWSPSLSPLAPVSWAGSYLSSLFTSLGSSLQDTATTLLDYQGFSSLHFSPFTWAWSWIPPVSSVTTTVSTAMGGLCSSLSLAVTSMGLLLSTAWATATGMVVNPSQGAMKMPELDMDQLVERVLNSERFLSTVNQIANTRVNTEAVRLQEQIDKALTGNGLSAVEQEKVAEDYRLKIGTIKAEVTEDIKLMTEQFMKTNLETADQSRARSEAQDAIILSLKEKYHKMLQDLETMRLSFSTGGQNIEGASPEILEEVSQLKSQILGLEEEQKMLNSSLSRCCKNITQVESFVEQHLAGLLHSVMTGEGDNPTATAFSHWITTNLVTKAEIEVQLSTFSSEVEARVSELGVSARKQTEVTNRELLARVTQELRQEMERRIEETRSAASPGDVPPPGQGLNRTEVLQIVKNSLIQYDADKTGMFDYALETAGGSVVSTRCTETYVQKTAMYSIFGIPVWYPSNNPRTIIQPGVQPGECWAFKGSSGFIVIQLSEAIVPTRFSMEHISKSMSPSGSIDSAPKDFVVYGLRSEKDTEPLRLGAFSYSQNTDPLQFFELLDQGEEAFPFIELDILSNHGNVNYTCLYRFRVHGARP